MKIEAQYPYVDCNIYLIYHKSLKRKMVSIRSKNGEYITTMTLARYKMSVYLKRILSRDEEVDHIDNDKTNDDISNLQILSSMDNRKKEGERRHIGIMVELLCPVCGTLFMFRKSNISTRPNPTCSRRCGGIKSHKAKIS